MKILKKTFLFIFVISIMTVAKLQCGRGEGSFDTVVLNPLLDYVIDFDEGFPVIWEDRLEPYFLQPCGNQRVGDKLIGGLVTRLLSLSTLQLASLNDERNEDRCLSIKEFLSYLKSKGVVLNRPDVNEITLLHVAVLKNIKPIFEYLVTQQDMNLNTYFFTSDNKRKTPLGLAIEASNVFMISSLLENKATLALYTGCPGLSLLGLALQNNNPAVLRAIINKINFEDVCYFLDHGTEAEKKFFNSHRGAILASLKRCNRKELLVAARQYSQPVAAFTAQWVDDSCEVVTRMFNSERHADCAELSEVCSLDLGCTGKLIERHAEKLVQALLECKNLKTLLNVLHRNIRIVAPLLFEKRGYKQKFINLLMHEGGQVAVSVLGDCDLEFRQLVLNNLPRQHYAALANTAVSSRNMSMVQLFYAIDPGLIKVDLLFTHDIFPQPGDALWEQAIEYAVSKKNWLAVNRLCLRPTTPCLYGFALLVILIENLLAKYPEELQIIPEDDQDKIITKKLISLGVAKELSNDEGLVNVFLFFIAQNNLRAVRFMVEDCGLNLRDDVVVKSNIGMGPIHLCASLRRENPKTGTVMDNFKMIEYFLSKGFNVNETALSNKFTPMIISVCCGDLPGVRWFAEHGASIDARTGSSASPLLVAIDNGRLDISEYLVNQYQLNTPENRAKYYLMHQAADKNSVAAINFLYDNGFGVNEAFVSVKGATPLHFAVARKSFEAVERLLALGADLDSEDNEKKLPIYFATLNKDQATISLLIQAWVKKYRETLPQLEEKMKLFYTLITAVLVKDASSVTTGRDMTSSGRKDGTNDKLRELDDFLQAVKLSIRDLLPQGMQPDIYPDTALSRLDALIRRLYSK